MNWRSGVNSRSTGACCGLRARALAPVRPTSRPIIVLCELIHAGKAQPSFIVSHQLPLNDAPEAYQHFGARDEGWTKVILKPAA